MKLLGVYEVEVEKHLPDMTVQQIKAHSSKRIDQAMAFGIKLGCRVDCKELTFTWKKLSK